MKRLGRTLEDLVRAEQNHLDELGNDAALRNCRDTAVSELRQDLFHLRDLLRGAYSRATAEELGLERRIAPVNPTGPAEGTDRVVRGGSWLVLARYVRAAARYWYVPGLRLGLLGFRLSRGQDGGAEATESQRV